MRSKPKQEERRRCCHAVGAVWTSWDEGSDLKRVEIHGPLGKSHQTNYVRVEDTGDELDATIQWNAGDKAVAKQIDANNLRDFAYEILAIADRIDKRAGRPVPEGPREDLLAKEFFKTFDRRED